MVAVGHRRRGVEAGPRYSPPAVGALTLPLVLAKPLLKRLLVYFKNQVT